MERMVSFTEQEMLREWKLRLGLLCESGLHTVVRNDMADADERLLSELRSWYAGKLLTASAGQVPVRNLAAEIKSAVYAGENAIRVQLPDAGYRLCEVKLSYWTEGVRVFHSPGSSFHLRQRDLWLRCTPGNPGVVRDGNEIIIYGLQPPGGEELNPPAVAKSLISELMMTAWPEDGSYCLSRELLDEILK